MYDLIATHIDVGRRVRYYSRNPNVPPEDGVITSMNNKYVFVRFDGDKHSKACLRIDLEYIEP